MSNLFDMSGRTALVVGGRGYLGQRFASTLADAGCTVHAADVDNVSRAARTSHASPSMHGRIHQLRIDVTEPASVEAAVHHVVAESGRLDVLVYSVTTKPGDFYRSFTDCSLAGWQQIMKVELDGLFLTAQSTGRVMEGQRAGSMIFLSSIYGVVGNDQRIYEGSNLPELYAGVDGGGKQYAHAGYAVAKGAVISFTRFLAAYWGAHNIRVNCISPGGIQHPGENAEFVRRYSDRVPLGRKARPDEVDGAVLFLASDASSYLTGQNLIIDGGWSAW